MQTFHLQVCAASSSPGVSRNGFEAATIIYSREGVEQILNLQPKGAKCKPYQVKQVRQIIVKYKLAGEADAEPEV